MYFYGFDPICINYCISSWEKKYLRVLRENIRNPKVWVYGNFLSEHLWWSDQKIFKFKNALRKDKIQGEKQYKVYVK